VIATAPVTIAMVQGFGFSMKIQGFTVSYSGGDGLARGDGGTASRRDSQVRRGRGADLWVSVH
jgi:hypothetical protein